MSAAWPKIGVGTQKKCGEIRFSMAQRLFQVRDRLFFSRHLLSSQDPAHQRLAAEWVSEELISSDTSPLDRNNIFQQRGQGRQQACWGWQIGVKLPVTFYDQNKVQTVEASLGRTVLGTERQWTEHRRPCPHNVLRSQICPEGRSSLPYSLVNFFFFFFFTLLQRNHFG